MQTVFSRCLKTTQNSASENLIHFVVIIFSELFKYFFNSNLNGNNIEKLLYSFIEINIGSPTSITSILLSFQAEDKL